MLFDGVSVKARLLLKASLCFFVVGAFVACADKSAEFYALSGSTMGTSYSIKVVVDEAAQAANASEIQQRVDSYLQDINQVMSTYIADSELSRLNRAPAGTSHAASSDLRQILSLARRVSEQSGGAFDITVGPLVGAWGFGPQKVAETLPSDEELEALMLRVGYEKLEVNPQGKVTKHAAIYLDLSSIAKGWAVDGLADILLAEGLQNFMVEIGGELRIRGKNPSGRPWTIGIENPSLFRSGPREAIASTNAAIATSGDYRNYREVDGKRFSHTIDPMSGKPITHKLASVTVVCDTAAEADAYSTAINVLGPKRGLAFAKQHQIAAYFIVRDGETFTTFETDTFKPYKVDL